MSYPPYQPGQMGYNSPYPGQYPNPAPSPNYGFTPGLASGVNPYPQPQPQIPPYPDSSSGSVASYPTASWGSSSGGISALPYPPQPVPAANSQSYSPYPQNPSPGGSFYPTGHQAPPSVYPTLGNLPPDIPQVATSAPFSYSSTPPSGANIHQVYPPGGNIQQSYPSSGNIQQSYPSSGSIQQSYPSHNIQQAYPSGGNFHQSFNTGSLQYPQGPSSYPQSHSPSGRHSPLPAHQQKMAFHGTVQEYQPFYPEEDAKTLRKAMKGLGTDEKAIIEVLAKRTNAQRQHISITYKTHFGRDLIKDLKSELSGHLEDVILAMMTPTAAYLAAQLHKAVTGLGTDESTIVEILCSSSNQELTAIKVAYGQMYGKHLEKHLIEDTSGHFRKLLVSLSMANRDESGFVDQGRAAQDARALYEAGEARWGTDESTFNSILVTQSFAQLRCVFAEYHKITGKSISNTIKGEFSGDVEKGLLAIVKCVDNIPGFYAERLYHSMAGAGTDDRTLIRIIATRCEIDLALIKQEFQKMFGKTVESFIAGDTSGDYKRVLLALVQ